MQEETCFTPTPTGIFQAIKTKMLSLETPTQAIYLGENEFRKALEHREARLFIDAVPANKAPDGEDHIFIFCTPVYRVRAETHLEVF